MTCGWRKDIGLRVISIRVILKFGQSSDDSLRVDGGELWVCELFLRSRLSLEVSHDMWMEESYWFASKSFRSELFQKFRLSSDDS